MKIKKVAVNNRKRVFEVATANRDYVFPFAKLKARPTKSDPVANVYVDRELAGEAFTYELESGAEGTVHIDHVLEYNRDPGHMRDMLLYRLTLVAKKRVQSSPLSKRELIRRLGTSPAQFYRLLDQTNYKKSLDQLMKLLHVLDCEIDLVVKKVPAKTKQAV